MGVEDEWFMNEPSEQCETRRESRGGVRGPLSTERLSFLSASPSFAPLCLYYY
ncbi:uncharacterized protein G2W53_031079 [Senna tora]|uniref:Uncharacterized protein n=1 Tax=Senna tora TaxID=362788 RepID=A0A834T8L5_9FABA|nr:uncharacterized protein G2W53_031079 [Senna tora]